MAGGTFTISNVGGGSFVVHETDNLIRAVFLAPSWVPRSSISLKLVNAHHVLPEVGANMYTSRSRSPRDQGEASSNRWQGGNSTGKRSPSQVSYSTDMAQMMYLALTYDHRLLDGREAVVFLVKVGQSWKTCIHADTRH